MLETDEMLGYAVQTPLTQPTDIFTACLEKT